MKSFKELPLLNKLDIELNRYLNLNDLNKYITSYFKGESGNEWGVWILYALKNGRRVSTFQIRYK